MGTKKNKAKILLNEEKLEHIAGGVFEPIGMSHLPEIPREIEEDRSTETTTSPPTEPHKDIALFSADSAPNITQIHAPTLDLSSTLFESAAKTKPSEALNQWLNSPTIDPMPQEAFIKDYPISEQTRSIVRTLTAKDPQAIAQIIQDRSAALQKDVETWSSWEKTTGSQKSKKLEMLKDIASKLKGDEAKDPQKVWAQLERLNWVEQHSNKVSLVDTLAYQLAKKQASKLGLKDNLETLDTKYLGLKTVSKHFYEDPAAQKVYQDGITALQDQMAEQILKENGTDSGNPLAELMQKDPNTAWNVLQLRAQALHKQLSQDGVHEEDARILNPTGGSPGIRQILAEKMPTQNVQQALQNQLTAIETIEKDSGYAPFSDVASAIAKGDIPLSQFKKPADAESWTDWAGRWAKTGADAAYSTVSQLAGLLASSVTSYANSAALGQAKGYTDATDKKVDDFTKVSLADRLLQLGRFKDEKRTRLDNDAWSLDNLRVSLQKSGDQQLLQNINTALEANKTADGSNIKSPRIIVQDVIQKYGKTNSISPETKAALEKYQSEIGTMGTMTAKISPWVTRSALKGVETAAQQGKLDALLSLDGISKTLESLNDFANEVKEGPNPQVSKEEMEKAYEKNIQAATNQITDTLLPPSYNPITMIKRFLLKMTIRDYYLKGIGELMVDTKKHDVFLQPIVNVLRSLKGVDLTQGTDAEKAHRKLAFSRIFSKLAEQIGTKPNTQSKDSKAASLVTKQAEILTNNMDLEKVLQIDPNSWTATGLKLTEGIGKSIIFHNPEKQKAKETVLQNVEDIAKLDPAFNTEKLTSLIQQDKIGEAKNIIETKLKQLGTENEQMPYWNKILENLNSYSGLTTGLSDLILSTHKKTINDKLIPWLHGQAP